MLNVPMSPSLSGISPKLSQSAASIRPSVGVSPINAVLQDRHDQLLAEFAEVDTNKDQELTFDEVYNFLKKKSGGEYDREICMGLFSKMDKDQDAVVTIEEFIWSYVETENNIKRRTTELKRQIADNIKQVDDYNRKLITAKATEKLGKNGIMEGSVLTVYVIEATIKSQQVLDPFIELSCEQQIIETKFASKTLTPTFNEVFTFQILEGSDDLYISVKNHSNFGNHKLIGESTYSLNLLRDQMKHDVYVDIKDPKGTPIGKVHLGLLWVYSKVKYYEAILTQWNENVQLDKAELAHLEDQLDKLHQPFGGLLIDAELVGSKTAGVEKAVSKKIENVVHGILGKDLDWHWSSYIVTLIYLLLSVMLMGYRPDFINVSVALGCFVYHVTKNDTDLSYMKLSFAILFAAVYDLLWFLFFSKAWSQSENFIEKEGEIRFWGEALTFICFIFKIACFAVFFRLGARTK
ncbi:unnamed protein product [Blepharisma stoltei]|uniref:C2 domain-containing protein n=1 Tax=Blepharisma stoltei TaxID=1481888 RepID=A0AAU9K7U3_9CILI|nr:unnamed protein product [Blepharisma stoltei]